MTPILPNQRWISKRDGREVRVMGIVEGYVVARYKGAFPWLESIKEFQKLFELKVTVP